MMRLEIDGWAQGLKFSASHFIPGHEKCGRLHGHTYAISAIIEGTQRDCGMVMDFVDVKNAIRKICDKLDHMVILPKNGRGIELNEGKKSVSVKCGTKLYKFPIQDVVIIDVSVPSAEELAKYALSQLLREIDFPKSISAVEICIEEGKGQGAWARETL